MLSNIIILISLIFQFSNNNNLTITHFCTIDSKYCERTLNVNSNKNLTYNSCDNIDETVQIDEEIWKKLSAINSKTLDEWRNDNSIDTTCGFLIKLDDNNYIYFDKHPENYQLPDIQEYIIMINDIFESLSN